MQELLQVAGVDTIRMSIQWALNNTKTCILVSITYITLLIRDTYSLCPKGY
ncbi:hypothetical protein [Thorsellia kenyensis]|uniref:hypothetical protein n=1 Tax=Thorsellia kenyensis TaxID=1549888 RepID=UPI0036DED95B